MVERYIAKIRINDNDLVRYFPKFPGISITPLERPKPDQMVLEFIASDVQIEQEHRYSFDQIRHKVLNEFRGRVIDDNLRTHWASPVRGLTIYGLINDPQLVGKGVPREVKQAAESATDLREVELTPKQVEAFEKQTKEHIEPKEVRQKEIERLSVNDEGRQTRTKERTEDIFVFTQGIIDSG